jgi:hypothetical protein
VPQFQDNERHDLLEIDKFARLHHAQQVFDIGGLEVAAPANLIFVQRLRDETSDLRMLEEKLLAQEEWIFFFDWSPVGEAAWQRSSAR